MQSALVMTGYSPSRLSLFTPHMLQGVSGGFPPSFGFLDFFIDPGKQVIPVLVKFMNY